VPRVYLDWNATTPPHADVLDAMREAARSGWANPSSLHQAGRAAKALVEDAREALALLLGHSPRDVVFTSGGTEANNLAVMRPFLPASGERPAGTLVTSRLEHPSVTAVAESLAEKGVRVVWLSAPPSGRIDPDEVDRALSQAGTGPRLVALQAVNHETGVLQPVADVVPIVRRHRAELHVDAVQAAGRVSAEAWRGADSVAVAAHKMRGPKGIGALAVRTGVAVRPLLRGGAQERGLRPGTVDAVAAAGFGVAARRAEGGPARYQGLAPLRSTIEQRLAALGARVGAPVCVNGSAPRAPHVSNFSTAAWAGDELVAALDLEGVCVSAGSACAAGTPEPSRIIAAMLGEERAKSAVRVSLGEETTKQDIETAIGVFERVFARRLSSA
jgi:cysteine desulfurase